MYMYFLSIPYLLYSHHVERKDGYISCNIINYIPKQHDDKIHPSRAYVMFFNDTKKDKKVIVCHFPRILHGEREKEDV